jgi:hypothetical protein
VCCRVCRRWSFAARGGAGVQDCTVNHCQNCPPLQRESTAGWIGDIDGASGPSDPFISCPDTFPESCSRSRARKRTQGTRLPSSRPLSTRRKTSRAHPTSFIQVTLPPTPRPSPITTKLNVPIVSENFATSIQFTA